MSDLELMHLTDAERTLIELIRHDQRFVITISRDQAHWRIQLEDPEIGNVGTGTGSNFQRAWDRVAFRGWPPPGSDLVRPDVEP